MAELVQSVTISARNIMPDRMPRRLRVGHATFDVIVDRDRCVEGNVNGLTHGDLRKIYLEQDMDPDLARAVLLHELLHAALYASGLKIDDSDEEERYVSAMTGPLLSALRENDDLVGFLLADMDGV